MLSSASVHYVLEDCIKKSLIEIPAVRYTHTNSMENAPELRSLGFPSALLCFPLRSFRSGRLDSHVPPGHDTSCNTSLPHYAPCESLFHLSSLPSVAANGGICYCQLIWPPLHPSVFFSPFGQGAQFLFCSFIMLWFCNFFMCIFRKSALEKEMVLFSMLSAACQQYDLEKKISLKLGLWFIIKSQHTLACFDMMVMAYAC